MTIPSPEFFPMTTQPDILNNYRNVIREKMKSYIIHCHLKSLVLGISGGIDSALCAALLEPVCREMGIPLIGRSITIETNHSDEIERSLQVGQSFCHDFEYLNLTETFMHNKINLIHFDDSKLSKLRQGNMKARMRMIILYDLAQLYHGIVISTDNYTEYLTGFWTLHGDVGDYAPIMNLWKTEVFFLAKNLLSECNEEQRKALQNCIDATPVDGLGISSCDCEQLGVPNYYEVDKIFHRYFSGEKNLENTILIQRYLNSEYKRNNPISISRKELLSL